MSCEPCSGRNVYNPLITAENVDERLQKWGVAQRVGRANQDELVLGTS